jgi:AraC family transcriptional regulator
MVCDRCIMVVKQQLETLDFYVKDISLGKVDIVPEPDESQLLQISSSLTLVGFELLDSEKQQIVQQIKNIIIAKVHHSDLSDGSTSFPLLLGSELNKDYTYLSRLFSQYEGIPIEKFIIQQKVEKVKELLEYGELNLNEISYKLGYSSSAHLSAQFKAITGLTPSSYKASDQTGRKSIDKL